MKSRNLGKAIGILIRQQMHEIEMHEDVEAFNAPSECHGIVAKGAVKRARLARRRALHAAGLRSLRLLRREARRVMGDDAPIYRRFGFVPY